MTSFLYRAQRGRFSTLGDFQLGGASSTKPKPRQTALISPNRIEVSVHTAFERHSPTQINDHGSCESGTEKVHEKPSAWSLGDDVERGMQKQVSVLETASQGITFRCISSRFVSLLLVGSSVIAP